jgi:hypothetical protein
MLNPYGGSGNRMGFVYNYPNEGSGYGEIVFGADGIARVTNVATAPYPGGRNQWFDVEFRGAVFLDGHDTIGVSVNGTPVFTDLDVGRLGGAIGLVTNWTPGRFDDVWFSHGGPFLLSETFQNDFSWFARRGTWDTQGGVLNNRTAAANDIVSMSWGSSTDTTMSARMLNPYGGPGNRIGLIFNFDTVAGDYYEVVFAPTGQAYLNKFIQGQLTQVATATHSALGRNLLVQRGAWPDGDPMRLSRSTTRSCSRTFRPHSWTRSVATSA